MREGKFKINNIIIRYLCFSIAGICLFLISYNFFGKFSLSESERYLDNTMESISKVNNKSKCFIDNGTLNVDKSLTTLPEMKTDLIDISLKLNSSIYSQEEDSIDNYANLSKGLNENILILEQLDAMLKNPYGNDIDLAANDLKIYRNTAEYYYNQIRLKKSSYDLGVSLHSAISSTIDYCISTNNSKRISELKSAEATKFLTILNELKISLDSLNKDFYLDVLKCRSGNKSYELLLTNIDDTVLKLDALNSVLHKMSIPDNYLPIYTDFSKTVSLYNDYVYGIKYAVVTEKVRRESKDIKEDFMDSLYVWSNKTYKNFEVMYNNFIEEYNNVVNNY